MGDSRIEDLPIAFTAVAANISRAKEVWFDEGPMFDAIRASISMPIIFTPYKYKGQDLVDGGILNPVPIAPTFSDHTDVTIAVNVCGKPMKNPEAVFKEDSLVELSPLSGAVSDLLGRSVHPSRMGQRISVRSILFHNLSKPCRVPSHARRSRLIHRTTSLKCPRTCALS